MYVSKICKTTLKRIKFKNKKTKINIYTSYIFTKPILKTNTKGNQSRIMRLFMTFNIFIHNYIVYKILDC